jgi:hypothetical protein
LDDRLVRLGHDVRAGWSRYVLLQLTWQVAGAFVGPIPLAVYRGVRSEWVVVGSVLLWLYRVLNLEIAIIGLKLCAGGVFGRREGAGGIINVRKLVEIALHTSLILGLALSLGTLSGEGTLLLELV